MMKIPDGSCVSTIAEFDKKVGKALEEVKPTPETREMVIEYMVSFAARLSMLAGGDVEKFLENARATFLRTKVVSENRPSKLVADGPNN